ncbi:hypothetical protein ACP26L_07040 [Paenibacillus sp. S-38]|uniref:hypothetical protein n=1 Tax=Paenibacillus sp. S-38 TaxID=3416710 RepID=UPI003CEDAB45
MPHSQEADGLTGLIGSRLGRLVREEGAAVEESGTESGTEAEPVRGLAGRSEIGSTLKGGARGGSSR